MVGHWLNRNIDANLSYTVTFEKKEVWPKVAENSSYVAVFNNAQSLATHVYAKYNHSIGRGRFHTYQNWLDITGATEITGDARARWLKFFQD